MGLLKNAIRNGISEGIGKGIGDAVGKAAEKIIAPKVENYANAAAAQLDEATQAMNENAQTIHEARAEGAAVEGAKAPASGSGFAALENAMGGWVQSAQNYATEMSKNFKRCPKCGEEVAANLKFCPECGTALPEGTLADETLCPKCGKQNVVGTKFCVECGTILPGFSAEEAAREAAEREAEEAERQAEEERKARMAAAEAEAKAKAVAAKNAVLDGAQNVGNMLGSFLKKKK